MFYIFPHFACNTGLALSFRPKFQSKILLLKFTFHLLSKFTLPVRAQIFFENLSYSSFFYKFLSKFNFLSLSFPSKRIFFAKMHRENHRFHIISDTDKPGLPISTGNAVIFRFTRFISEKNRISIFSFFL